MNINATRAGSTLTLTVGQRLDFNSHQDFRRSYEGVDGVSELVVDFAATEYMDSSALGMLLLMREACLPRARIRLANCRPSVKKILTIANLHKLFAID